MKILFCSVPFRPSVGGIETVSALLAERFHRDGHEVTLVTLSDGDGDGDGDGVESEPYDVVRRPSMWRLFQLVRAADVVFHNNISLKLAWPLLWLRRPWVVAHHTWIPAAGLAARVKRLALTRATNVAVSVALAKSLPVPCRIVPNPYADDVFVRAHDAPPAGDLVVVGRLVSDKGVDVLLEALALLARRGRHLRLTVIGDGPEAEPLRQQAARLGVSGQVDFAGRRVGADLVKALQAHPVMVVPSVWEEPFGVVVLEGLACGCVPIASRSGGLPDAVGPCGVLVPPKDAPALANAIAGLAGNAQALAHLKELATVHLARHTRERVGRAYLEILEDAHGTHSAQGAARVA